MKMEFIGEGPALVIESDQRMLIVADLHFGIEADLAAHGLHFDCRGSARHDHDSTDAELVCRQRHALRMVAGGSGNDTLYGETGNDILRGE